VIDSLVDCHRERLVVERSIEPVVDRPRVEHELLAHQVEQLGQRVDGDDLSGVQQQGGQHPADPPVR
jgi:hypothetical protein